MAHPAKDSKEKIEYGLNIRRYFLNIFSSYYYSNPITKLSYINRFGKGVVARIMNPLMANDWIFRMSPLGRDSKECIKELHHFTDNVNYLNQFAKLKNSCEFFCC